LRNLPPATGVEHSGQFHREHPGRMSHTDAGARQREPGAIAGHRTGRGGQRVGESRGAERIVIVFVEVTGRAVGIGKSYRLASDLAANILRAGHDLFSPQRIGLPREDGMIDGVPADVVPGGGQPADFVPVHATQRFAYARIDSPVQHDLRLGKYRSQRGQGQAFVRLGIFQERRERPAGARRDELGLHANQPQHVGHEQPPAARVPGRDIEARPNPQTIQHRQRVLQRTCRHVVKGDRDGCGLLLAVNPGRLRKSGEILRQ
jgi:hypothetical protein